MVNNTSSFGWVDQKGQEGISGQAYQQVHYPQMLRESLWIFVDLCGYSIQSYLHAGRPVGLPKDFTRKTPCPGSPSPLGVLGARADGQGVTGDTNHFMTYGWYQFIAVLRTSPE
jgi:hypothetical protein